MIFNKKLIVCITVFIMVLNFSIWVKVTEAYDIPNIYNISDEDENYYGWTGFFYWFGDNNVINEKLHSWNAPPDFPETLYGVEHDIYITGYEDNNANENFGFKADRASWIEGRNVYYHDDKYRWEKPVIVHYKREKTYPQHEYITVEAEKQSNQYIEGAIDKYKAKWIKGNSIVNVTIANKQHWLGDAGVVLKDYVKSNSMKIAADGKDCFEVTSDRGSSSNTEVKGMFCSALSHTSSSESFSYDKYESVSNTYKMKFYIDADYTIKEAAKSENGKSIGYGNDISFKVDSAGPLWDGVIIDNNGEVKDNEDDKEVYDNLQDYKVVNGFRCLIKNLHDVRSNGRDGVGVDYSNSDAMILEIIRSDDKSKLVTINGSHEYKDKKNRLYDIDFHDEVFADKFKNYYGGIDIVFKTKDMLGNETVKDIAHLEKVKPIPKNGDIKVEKYDYKEEGRERYWVKSNSVFMIYTDGYFHTKDSYFKDPDFDKNYKEQTIYPTESDLIFTIDPSLKDKFFNHEGKIERKSEKIINDSENDDGKKTSKESETNDGKEAADGNKTDVENSNNENNQDNQNSNNNVDNQNNNEEEDKYKISEEDEESLRGIVKARLPLNHAVQEKIKESDGSYKNCIEVLHCLSSQTDTNKYFKLYMKTGYGDNTYKSSFDTIFYSDIKDTGISLNIDGISPTGKGEISFNADDCTLKLEAKKVLDEGGSGVKKVFALCYDSIEGYSDEEDNKIMQNYEMHNYESGKILELKAVEDNKWTLETDAKELFRPNEKFNYNNVTVDIFAEDNVGNITKLCSKTMEVFTLTAKIVPFNNVDYEYIEGTEGPTFQQGQAALLIINTTGYAQSLNIQLPEGMSPVPETFQDIRYKKENEEEETNVTLDSSKYSDKEEIEFIIPFNAEAKVYSVLVTAYKNKEEITGEPVFKVSDNVLDRVRTRLR